MKIKFLLATLAGVALVACTQDDDFVINKAPEAQSPITFTVHMDDELTRASLNGAQVIFEEGDLISLYNGFDADNRVEKANQYGTADYKGYTHNSIFEGTENNGALKFTSRAMVFSGGAVMVYPADTTFVWDDTKDKYLAVKIDAKQKKGYSGFVPQVTDFFDIDTYSGDINDDNTAGYGRNYEVRFKALGSLLRLTMDPIGEGLSSDLKALEVTKVELINGSDDIFNTEAKLGIRGGVNPGDGVSTLKAYDANKYSHFLNQTVFYYDDQLDPTDAVAKVAALSTEDIKVVNGKDVAYFVMLPNSYRDEAGSGPITADAASSIKITTNYGTVTVDNNALTPITRTVPTSNPNDPANGPFTIKAGLENILGATWLKNTTAGSAFNGSYGGASIQRTLKFNLSDIDMNGTVIHNEEELYNFVKAYKALGKTGPTTVELKAAIKGTDGKYGNPTKRFIMSDRALKALDEIGLGNVSMYTAADTIVLDQSHASNPVTKYSFFNNSNVRFVKAITGGLASTVKLALKGTWSLDQKETFSQVSEIFNEGALTVTNTDGKNATAPFLKDIQLTNKAKATLSISGNVYMSKVKAEKESGITVLPNSRYNATQVTHLYGTVSIPATGKLISNYTTDVVNLGTINNSGEISVADNPSGNAFVFRNGGTINNLNGAYTLITTNQYNSGANIGTINLTTRTNEVVIKDPSKAGYIKYTMKVDEATGFKVDALPGDKFNYLIVSATIPGSVEVDITDMATVVDYLRFEDNSPIATPPTSTIINVLNDKEGGHDVIDLFVKTNTLYYLSQNITLRATGNVWVNGAIVHSGKLTYTAANLNTNNGKYISKTYTDKEEAFSGEIRRN